MLTQKQFDLLVFIKQSTDRNHITPSFDEMREALSLKSKSSYMVIARRTYMYAWSTYDMCNVQIAMYLMRFARPCKLRNAVKSRGGTEANCRHWKRGTCAVPEIVHIGDRVQYNCALLGTSCPDSTPGCYS